MRFPKTPKRYKSQLSFAGDHAQLKPNLSLTLGQNQTGNLLEFNQTGKTGGNLLYVDKTANIYTTGSISATTNNQSASFTNISGNNFSGQYWTTNGSSNAMTFLTGTSGGYGFGIQQTNSITSGTVAQLYVNPTYNQLTATTANTDFLINRVQTFIGSGTQLFIDAQVSGVSKFSVTNTGAVTGLSFAGSGASLTSLNASNITSGTVPTAQLGSGTANSTTYLRGDLTWATITSGGTPGGSTTQLQYNNAGAFGGTSGLTWDSTNLALTLASSSLTGTTSFPVLNLSQTWNNVSGSFTALKLNVTNTNSATTSSLMDLQVGGTSQFKVGVTGAITATDNSTNQLLFFNGNSGVDLYRATNVAVFELRRCNNTIASPTAVASTQFIGTQRYWGYDGSAYTLGSTIRAIINGTVSSAVMPTDLQFLTYGVADGLNTRLQLTTLGNTVIGSGTDNGTDKLQVGGTIALGSNTSTSTSTPVYINSGGTYGSNTAGSSGNLKWMMYNDGAGNKYGIGMSPGLMEIQAGTSGAIAFFTNLGTETFRASQGARVLIGTTTDNGTDKLQVAGTGIFTTNDNSFNYGLNFTNTNTGTNALVGLGINNSSGSRVGQLFYAASNYTDPTLASTLAFGSINSKLGFVSMAGSGSVRDIYFQTGTTKAIYIVGSNSHVLVNTSTDNGTDTLQVNGSISATAITNNISRQKILTSYGKSVSGSTVSSGSSATIQSEINFVAGSNVTLAVNDDTTNSRVDVTITANSTSNNATFVQTFNATTDWGTASGGFYTISFTHNFNTYGVTVQIWDETSSHVLAQVGTTTLTSVNAVSIAVPSSPDNRFAGRIVVVSNTTTQITAIVDSNGNLQNQALLSIVLAAQIFS